MYGMLRHVDWCMVTDFFLYKTTWHWKWRQCATSKLFACRPSITSQETCIFVNIAGSILPVLLTIQTVNTFWLLQVNAECLFFTWDGGRVAQWLRCCATNRKVAGSIPDGVIGIFHWHNPSDRTMALGSTQSLTEMIRTSVLILLASCQQTCMTYTVAVCTLKNCWWWTEKLSETCRVLFQK